MTETEQTETIAAVQLALAAQTTAVQAWLDTATAPLDATGLQIVLDDLVAGQPAAATAAVVPPVP